MRCGAGETTRNHSDVLLDARLRIRCLVLVHPVYEAALDHTTLAHLAAHGEHKVKGGETSLL